MGELPLPVDNPERDVLVRRPSAELQNDCVIVTRLLDDLIRRSFGFVDEIRIEDVELVSLHHFRGRVVGATLEGEHT